MCKASSENPEHVPNDKTVQSPKSCEQQKALLHRGALSLAPFQGACSFPGCSRNAVGWVGPRAALSRPPLAMAPCMGGRGGRWSWDQRKSLAHSELAPVQAEGHSCFPADEAGQLSC